MTIDPRTIAADIMCDAARDITRADIWAHIGQAYDTAEIDEAAAGRLVTDVNNLITVAGIDLIWPDGTTDAELDIDAIHQFAEATTPGPWEAYPDGLVWAPRLGDPVSGSTELVDAQFIARARQDVPALCTEVRRLRAELVAAEQTVASMRAALDDADAEAVAW